ncbi:MAG: hypothetical protein IKR50_06445 [Prevotella sp.]|nr:hypothetical protein [Prevotella sp.]
MNRFALVFTDGRLAVATRRIQVADGFTPFFLYQIEKMNITKKLFAMTMLLYCFAVGTWAEKALVIEFRSGDTSTFVLSQKPEINFSNHLLHLSVYDSNNDFEIADVAQFYFAEETQGVEEVKKNGTIRIAYSSNDKVIVEGLSATDHLRLYSLEGIQYAGRVSVADGSAVVSLQSLPKGTYLINIKDKQTLKVLRK